ncbi:DegT/DnrJ/EryC1/StrS family aminotransferase [Sphingobacterium rhinopitheci]|uniref:DegT/DnrJ/EryC1/StrS family aminotransferase n=1 Tax=Sphingobacterium rhinopitheci TaxID=2781960 RepID=UPI001F52776D|nr:DegT/DnrJ/EryC1/StrS family aminotransferase [Sphingobacterium rhinopitheci]MCI0921456.1 DegT/DnrJ/EryC1/StrS family aminotransferase [Sphingobacterium rhinopitheci]
MIQVTKPFLPPVEDYKKYIDKIWQRQWLTNMGPLSSELEMQLKEFLNLDHLIFVTNGTVALQLAIRALDLKGEIITTPFSFVATTSSIVWEGCTPVFVDIDKNSLNIDADKIEAAITENTSAILATHVYGNPCEIDKIEEIAKKHNLKIIYDAAHAFAVQYKGKSVFEYGDISICSLHATKLYHSTEGGLIITKDPSLLKKAALMRNFGISDFNKFAELGINGKNSEFHAAMGLVNLKYVDDIIAKRRELSLQYNIGLKNVKGYFPTWNTNSDPNFAYYPIVLQTEQLLLNVMEELGKNQIFTRRYFYPSLASALPYLEPKDLPITDDISKRVLCLPLYYDLTIEEVNLITRLILRTQNNTQW